MNLGKESVLETEVFIIEQISEKMVNKNKKIRTYRCCIGLERAPKEKIYERYWKKDLFRKI